ncbi:Transposable element P transposase, partial [Paramuricea clavata]
ENQESRFPSGHTKFHDTQVINNASKRYPKGQIFVISNSRSDCILKGKLSSFARITINSSCGPDKLRATVVTARSKCKLLEGELQELQKNITSQGVSIDKTLEEEILKIMDGQNLDSTPHMKFFWQEQMKLLQSSSCGRIYHPQIIRFALSVHGKSPSAYRELRETGVNAESAESLRNKVKSFSGIQRYVVLVMDKMKVQSNLEYDKHSGDLIGFIDLVDPMTNYACLDKEDSVATHALTFLVRGLGTDMKHIIAYYFTGNVTSYHLMPIFWKVVSTLELSLDLWVIGLVNDCASPNRKLFNLHSTLADEDECDVVYKTLNLFAPLRFVYFFADSPHLLKTASKLLDQAVELHVLPKLTLDHITLTSYSKMKYLESLKASTHEREGDFSDDARGKMFLSMQTYEGLKIYAFSHVEAIKFLMEIWFKYVLSEMFMQDVLEDYFGHQRSKGRRADNPSAYEFGYNDLTNAAQRDIAPVVRGDVGGRYEKKKWFTVSDEPAQKRKKK